METTGSCSAIVCQIIEFLGFSTVYNVFLSSGLGLLNFLARNIEFLMENSKKRWENVRFSSLDIKKIAFLARNIEFLSENSKKRWENVGVSSLDIKKIAFLVRKIEFWVENSKNVRKMYVFQVLISKILLF